MKKILIVDDEVDLREAFGEFFRMEGFLVIEAESGNKALNILLTEKVDFIISDIRMPDGNGVFLLDEMKLRIKNSPPILMVTGFADISCDEIKAKGAIDMLTKPIDLDFILELVKKNILETK